MLRLFDEDNYIVAEGDAFDCDYSTLRLVKDGRFEPKFEHQMGLWAAAEAAGADLREIRLADNAGSIVVAAFIDYDEREVFSIEMREFFFGVGARGDGVLGAAKGGGGLARMAQGTGEWEPHARPRLWCPRIVFTTKARPLVFEAVRFEATPRARLSQLAERVGLQH